MQGSGVSESRHGKHDDDELKRAGSGVFAGDPKVDPGLQNDAELELQTSSNKGDEREADSTGYSGFAAFFRSRKCCIFTLACAFFCGYACYSVIAPSFSTEATKKNLHATQRGIVFSAYSLTAFVTCPIVGYMIRKVSPKSVIIIGCFLASFTTIAFGFTYLITDSDSFFFSALGLRIAEGFGYGIYTTTGYIVIFKMFPNSFAKVLGLLETFAGIGLAAGPAIGGGLNEIGGFFAPFLFLGGLFALISAVLVYAIPVELARVQKRETVQENTPGVKDLLLDFQSCAAILHVFSSSYTFSYVFPVLEPHLVETCRIEEKHVALVFCALLAPYSVSTLVAGHVVHAFHSALFICIGGGWIALSAGYACLGPTLMTSTIPTTLGMKIFALVLIGAGLGFTTIPTFEALRRAAMSAGFSDDLKTYGIISGTFNSTYALGEAVGPLIAGAAMDYRGFTYSMRIAMCQCIAMVGLAVFCQHYSSLRNVASKLRRRGRPRSKIYVLPRPAAIEAPVDSRSSETVSPVAFPEFLEFPEKSPVYPVSYLRRTASKISIPEALAVTPELSVAA